MRWIAKAAVQRGLSAVPGGDRANYLLQRHVTRQIPRSDAHFKLHARETVRHFHALTRFVSDVDPAAARLYEFGAGWDLITPLVFFALGITDQTLVDIRANLRLEQVEHTLDQMARHHAWLTAEAGGASLRSAPTEPLNSASDLSSRFGITYLAPRDARDTGLAGESFDFVSSTYTLEHIPRADVAPILAECRRLLRLGGALSGVVDMKDHYSYGDSSISAFNFLKYSDRTWRLVNSPLHHQNRLRESDYRRLLEDAGLRIAAEESTGGRAEDVEAVASMELGERFRGRPPEDLASREVHLVGTRND